MTQFEANNLEIGEHIRCKTGIKRVISLERNVFTKDVDYIQWSKVDGNGNNVGMDKIDYFEKISYKQLPNFDQNCEMNLSHILRLLGTIDLKLDRNILWINKTILWDLRIDLLCKQHENTIEKLSQLIETKFN